MRQRLALVAIKKNDVAGCGLLLAQLPTQSNPLDLAGNLPSFQRVLLPPVVPGDVAHVPILEQNISFGHRAPQPTSHAFTTFLDAHLARRPPEGTCAGIDRAGQNFVRSVVCRQFPDDIAPLRIVGFDWQYEPSSGSQI
jgi:hypothetical protein